MPTLRSMGLRRSNGVIRRLQRGANPRQRSTEARAAIDGHHGELSSSDPKPGPGSEVFVPVRDTTQHVNYVQLIGGIAQIIASTIAIIVVATK